MAVMMCFFVATLVGDSEAAAKSEHSQGRAQIDLDDGRIGAKTLSVLHAVIERRPRLLVDEQSVPAAFCYSTAVAGIKPMVPALS